MCGLLPAPDPHLSLPSDCAISLYFPVALSAIPLFLRVLRVHFGYSLSAQKRVNNYCECPALELVLQVEVLGSLEETREMELYTGGDEIQIQVTE